MTAHDVLAMRETTIQLVCLDLGGVLVRICRGWEEACRAARLDLRGLKATPEVWGRLSAISRRHETGVIDDEQFDLAIANATGLSPCEVGRAADAWLRGAYPGAVELVGRLARAQGVRVACLSNTNPRHWRAMNRHGPNFLRLDRLDWRFLSFEMGHMKPMAEIYRLVEQATGILPAHILFFDDNANNIEAACALGWHGELIDPAGDPPEQVMKHLRRYGVELEG